MFSGFVSRISLRSFGSSTGTDVTTTGIVIRKMISNTSITSTRGVVLIVEMGSSSSAQEPTFIAMAYPRATTLGALSSTACRSAPKPRTLSIAVLFRRTSQL